MFEILVNGISRTHRDLQETALDAGRVLKFRDLNSEVKVVNETTKQWVIVTDGVFATPRWSDV